MTDLKPCPFCGSENTAMFYQNENPYGDTDIRYFVKCKKCKCRSKKCKSEEMASHRWNRREKE